MMNRYWGNITDWDNKKGGIVHGLNVHTYALKKGYRSKADGICPMILYFAEELDARSAPDLIRKYELQIDSNQRWSVQGKKIPLNQHCQNTLRTVFRYSTDYSYNQLEAIFETNTKNHRLNTK